MRKHLTSLVAAAALALIAGQGCRQEDTAPAARSGGGSVSAAGGPSASASPRSTGASASSGSTAASASQGQPYGTGMKTTGDSAAGQSLQGTADSAGRAAQGAADSTGRAAQGAADSTGRAIQGAADSTGRAAGDAADAADNAPSAAGAGASADAQTTEAQKLIDEATNYIKENKLDLADQTLAKLEQMKPQLPASVGSKIDATRKLLNTAKSGSGLLGGSTGGTR